MSGGPASPCLRLMVRGVTLKLDGIWTQVITQLAHFALCSFSIAERARSFQMLIAPHTAIGMAIWMGSRSVGLSGEEFLTEKL